MKRSFTLVELLIVIMIIGILAALAMPGLNKTRERTLDREAKANLALIQAAEKIYKMEAGFYYPQATASADNVGINTWLRVNLPVTESNWSYSADKALSQITASRLPSGRTWSLTYTGDTPTCSGSGCP